MDRPLGAPAPLRVPGGPGLRAPRHRHPGPGVHGRAICGPVVSGPPGRGLPDRRAVRRRRRHVLLRLHGHRAQGPAGRGPHPHRAGGRLHRRDRHGAGRGVDGRHPLRPRHRGRPGRGGGATRRHRPRHGPADGHHRSARFALPKSGAPPLGGGGPALPRRRELHHGLPHLLMLHGGGHQRSHRHPGRAGAPLGFVLHHRVHLHRRPPHPPERQGPLPPVADPQAGLLVGAVRDLGVCGLRALHHLVPGSDRSDL